MVEEFTEVLEELEKTKWKALLRYQEGATLSGLIVRKSSLAMDTAETAHSVLLKPWSAAVSRSCCLCI